MASIDRWKISPETRAKFEGLLDEAPKLGIDRDQVAAAGLPGLRALIALKQAAEAGTARVRKRALSEAQGAVASLAHRKRPNLSASFRHTFWPCRGGGATPRLPMWREASRRHCRPPKL